MRSYSFLPWLIKSRNQNWLYGLGHGCLYSKMIRNALPARCHCTAKIEAPLSPSRILDFNFIHFFHRRTQCIGRHGLSYVSYAFFFMRGHSFTNRHFKSAAWHECAPSIMFNSDMNLCRQLDASAVASASFHVSCCTITEWHIIPILGTSLTQNQRIKNYYLVFFQFVNESSVNT